METLFKPKLKATASSIHPVKITDDKLQQIIDVVNLIKKNINKNDTILKQQWFMKDVGNLKHNDNTEADREYILYTQTLKLFHTGVERFKIRDNARMILFFKLLFQD